MLGSLDMETLAGSPLTLVVKAPNQEVGDQTVECFLEWTVRKLKKHLSAVYPTNPNERSQRIIYSGKLLQDNLLLKDVLYVTDPKDKCTVHLVCTPSPEEQAKRDRSCSRQSKETVLPNNDGLRQRTSAQRVPQPEQPYQTVYPNATPLPSTSGSVPVPHPGVMPNSSMSTAQMQWMQHMYAQQQQMAAYMQYASMMAASSGGMQAGWNPAYPMTSSPWLPPTVPHPATTINQPHPAPAPAQPGEAAPPQAAAAAAPAAPAAAPPPQRMNVGGGGGDIDEEGARRDWLDWTFTLCRFGILLSIVYFYSSIHRFLMVAGAVFVLYLYQSGYFQLRRRLRARPPVTPPQEQPPREEAMPQDGEQEPNDNQPDESESSTSTSDDVDGNTEAEPAEPPRPGMLLTVWIFVSTFFTSILPQGPPQQFPAN
ncbi:homocysteine-responsive endoplasmic reticulum-resident ubiquitin-like domain member 2 protein isoform X1 [Strongylocentrotus purpuratus]|uniref:Ubiquitin-like domain-containing protein n=2 Tax=Strongylocentrotus purpuratus TaxID=7668 RepID=A0A7M7LU00_STRPU|nr:homocysteine-responsive endoplasmic reticulum-resident ubiquitin-like domain member 2 protein isoform X1 [Strongylocentrotus purpuratus]|eukprot:XP_011682075.1 PREDICTED: homocysteine-responsive endoplasmic reticulum-resident ubiquitin-like domain member 2 protein isoform X1 [Strongylocentrotus purpuratus]